MQKHILVTGLVQGVGFRPFVYSLANNLSLKGWVENSNRGVEIFLRGSAENIKKFIIHLSSEAPPASRIDDITFLSCDSGPRLNAFSIRQSTDKGAQVTSVSPDLCVCEQCLADMQTMENRIDYPFINCTQCGPRFSIIKELPYDRPKTTMDSFTMCPDCLKEYDAVDNRRFHAQPNACLKCGPSYELFIGGTYISDLKLILESLKDVLLQEGVLALKGVGGFQLACLASSSRAVSRLRVIKKRDAKPFAVMFPDLESIRKYAHMTDLEEKTLLSMQRPIVLLSKKNDLAGEVSQGLYALGCMLPNTPLHYLLFNDRKLGPLVLTSGNFFTQPMVIGNQEALDKFSSVVDGVLLHNREIYNRNDDSVVVVVNNIARILRRARGYAPDPIKVTCNIESMTAVGGESKNTFAMGKGNQAILSQYIGDLKNIETMDFFIESLFRFQKLFRTNQNLIVHDQHPDYLSTKYAKGNSSKVKTVGVYHHVAHVASCMAEHQLDEKVIGVAFDGTGYGEDGHIWGSEFFVMDFHSQRRVCHLEYVPMPGGDKASKEGWRMALAYLHKTYGSSLISLDIPFVQNLAKPKVAILLHSIDNKINTPLTSSMGRLFDAVAALIGVAQTSQYEAQAAMQLESLVYESSTAACYEYEIGDTILLEKTIRGIISDLQYSVPKAQISRKFHNTVVDIVLNVVKKTHQETGIRKVVLSGGTFQNRYLLENTENILRANDFEVYSHERVPSNDGGLALGQLVLGSYC